MVFRFLVAVIIPVLIGLCAVEIAVPTLRSFPMLYWVFSVSIGFGLDALVFFWFRRPFVAAELLLLAVAGVVFCSVRKRRSK